MAGEIQLAQGTTGLTVYAVLRSSVGQVWNTSTPGLENFNSAHWTSYAISMPEQGGGYYAGNFPSTAVAGSYNVEARIQAGGSPSITDVLAGSGSLSWDGTQVVIVPNSTQAADALLGRNNAGGSSSGRTVSQSLQTIRNKITIVGTVLTVYAEDDATILYQANLTTNAAATPITASTPTS